MKRFSPPAARCSFDRNSKMPYMHSEQKLVAQEMAVNSSIPPLLIITHLGDLAVDNLILSRSPKCSPPVLSRFQDLLYRGRIRVVTDYPILARTVRRA
jgi:hypothetical protein